MTSMDTYQLKWHSHITHLDGSVSSLLHSERFTDVVLCTLDGTQLPAHKFMLNSCSNYFSSLFENQRFPSRADGMMYVVLPPEITSRALMLLVEYMYKGETNVSNDVLDIVLKAGQILKVRGLWRQNDGDSGESGLPVEKPALPTPATSCNNRVDPPAPVTPVEQPSQPKIFVKKDDKLLKTLGPVQTQGLPPRQMFLRSPKLVFIKTAEGVAQPGRNPGVGSSQTILVASGPPPAINTFTTRGVVAPSSTIALATTTIDDSPDEASPPRPCRRTTMKRKYGKRQKTASYPTHDVMAGHAASKFREQPTKRTMGTNTTTTDFIGIGTIPDRTDWSTTNMFQANMNVKPEANNEVVIEGERQTMFSPISCELCADVFTMPAEWLRHVIAHTRSEMPYPLKRKQRSVSDDTEETSALLRCDLCQKLFPNPAEWVRHIQNTHIDLDSGERPFVCGLCNKSFNVKSNLLRHQRVFHN